jgi:hypothetical protein
VGRNEEIGPAGYLPLFFLFYVSLFLLFKFKLISNLNFQSRGKLILNFILCHEQYQFGDCWNLLSVARKPTRVNSVDNRVTC